VVIPPPPVAPLTHRPAPPHPRVRTGLRSSTPPYRPTFSAAHPARLESMFALLSSWPEAPGRVDLVTRQLGARDRALKRALKEHGYWKSERGEPASKTKAE
jgi:hypothetical protein